MKVPNNRGITCEKGGEGSRKGREGRRGRGRGGRRGRGEEGEGGRERVGRKERKVGRAREGGGEEEWDNCYLANIA